MTEGDAFPRMTGLRVLVVEDEALISMLFEDVLGELGCTVVGPALNLRHAIDLATFSEIDAAILDVNLNGDPIFPVAEILAGRAIPLLFASGYGTAGMPERWQDRPTLPKPFNIQDVETALRRLVAGPSPPPLAG